MRKRVVASMLVAGALLTPFGVSAADLKAYIGPFAVTPQEAAPLKETLQRLLTSRISGDGITTVGTPAEAELLISGSYTQIGKTFSLDAVAKLPNGQTVATAFEQGDNQDLVIPAVGKVSAKLKAEAVKKVTAAAPQAPTPAPQAAQTSQAQKAQASQSAGPGSRVWISARIPGAQSAIAPAAEDSYFVAEAQKLRLYRQEKTLKMVAEAEVTGSGKIVALDTAVGADGVVKAYLTIVDGEGPASRIYAFRNGKLELLAENLPYLFRSVALDGGPAKLYAQQMGREDDYYGEVFEVSESGGKIQHKEAIKLPRYANVYNFNRFTDSEGKSNFVTFSTDGYLVVFSAAGEELWRSSDKFGGSESYFQREALKDVRVTDSKYRWVFINQRITVTPKNEIIVPQNGGLFVVGNQRSYDKHTVNCFEWNGSSLDERWKSKEAASYLADYFYRADKGELVLLDVVQKEGLFTKGGSTIEVIKAQ